MNPENGFGFQRVYTDDRSLDIAIPVEDGDVVLVPKGHHPCGAPYGFEMYYLNVMAGPSGSGGFCQLLKLNGSLRGWLMPGSAIYPSLKDKIIFITGGASGIGESIVRAFDRQGAVVGILDIDSASANKLINDLDGRHQFYNVIYAILMS